VVTCEGGTYPCLIILFPPQNPKSPGTSPLGLTSLKRKNFPIVVTLGGIGSCYASLAFKPRALSLATNYAITCPYLKDAYANCRKPSPICGGSHHRMSRSIETSLTSWPHNIQCGYRCERILIRSGYRCATVSYRVTSTWSLANGTTSGRFQSSPKTCRTEQRKKRQGREKQSLSKSKCPRDE
jgi:hypothetical protein